MADRKRVLFISHTFPPDAQVGGKRVARFARYLPEFGIEPVILTVQECFYESLDRSYTLPEGLRLVRTSVLQTPLDWYSNWARRRSAPAALSKVQTRPASAPTIEMPANQKPGGLRAHLRALLEMPNENWGWYPDAVRAGSEILRQNAISAIVSSAPPWTCHLVAWRLKSKFHIPWIADFRDAWTFNPWRPKVPKWRDDLDDRMERGIVTNADRVTSVSEPIVEDFRAKYPRLPADKFVTITNGFEGEFTAPASTPPGSPRLFVHLGSLYFDRGIEAFCRAVAKLIDDGRVEPGSVRFLFVGTVSPEIVTRAQRETPDLIRTGIIEFRGFVPYAEGQRLLRSADVLLLLLGDNRHVVTAKFYEYIATAKPVFVVAKEGALSKMVAETGVGICADPDDPKAIAQGLIAALDLPSRTPSDFDAMVRRFHFRNLSAKLAGLIRDLSPPAPAAR